MTNLTAGQSLLLNNRLWTLRRVREHSGRRLLLEVIGASEAAQGMSRRLRAVRYGNDLFIARRRGGYWQANLATGWVSGEFGPVLKCQSAGSLDLLDAHTRHLAAGSLPNEFSWSFSRQALYDQCPRAYYYHYYASWEGWQADAPEPVRQAYLLKNLTNISAWTGRLVHESIKFALARLKAGSPVNPDELVQQMHRRARADFQSSKEGSFRRQPNKRVGFREHFYREKVPQSAWQTAWTLAQKHLLTFLNSPLYAYLRDLPPARLLAIEELHAFDLAGTKIWVQLDLACRDGETIRLFDWKTGGEEAENARRQLGVYALFARQTWSADASRPISGTIFNLPENRLQEFEFTETDLQQAHDHIKTSIDNLQSLLINPTSANLAELRRFPMIDDLNVCRQCQFKALCGRD